mmetsp:Transcript_108250/g.337349  ORF Transcript_108250/g.337349 Transcript_108250/m.337349 type:complete len:97 (-) Transcript_108250:528-818(-)
MVAEVVVVTVEASVVVTVVAVVVVASVVVTVVVVTVVAVAVVAVAVVVFVVGQSAGPAMNVTNTVPIVADSSSRWQSVLTWSKEKYLQPDFSLHLS